MKVLLNKAASAVGSAGKTVSTSVERTIQGAKASVLDTAADAAKAGKNAAFTVEAAVLGARDATLDKVASAAGSALKVCYGIAGTVRFMVEAGIVVVAVVAPVPTIIGVGLLWLLQRQLQQTGALVDEVIGEDCSKRKLERVSGLLKKYGQIPETATLETDFVTMVINSSTGVVSGTVLAGEFRGCSLDALSSEDLGRLIEYVRDDDTKNILEAYQSLRKARVSAVSN